MLSDSCDMTFYIRKNKNNSKWNVLNEQPTQKSSYEYPHMVHVCASPPQWLCIFKAHLDKSIIENRSTEQIAITQTTIELQSTDSERTKAKQQQQSFQKCLASDKMINKF